MVNNVSRRDFLTKAAVASLGIQSARAAQTTLPSSELLALHERLLVARAERDRLHQFVKEVGGVRDADHENDFSRRNSELEAAESIVCDIERAMVDFEPRSIADLRLQVELALHQEVIDYGMDEHLPLKLCERFVRLFSSTSE
jgi:hypothetical protein